MRTTCIATAIVLTIALGAYLVLHFAEPVLSMTWSYAHLGRSPVLWILAALLVIGLPPLAVALAARPEASEPVRPWSWRAVAAWTVGLAAGLVVLGALFPTPHFSIDVLYYVEAVRDAKLENARWCLLLWFMIHLATALKHWIAADHLIRTTNGVFSAIALVALAGAARRLGRTRGEAIVITLLTVSAYGVAQLLMGYLDIYPTALAWTAVYLWTAFAALDGAMHPAVPLVIVTLAPFWYIGLVQLAPSAAVVVLVELRRTGGMRRLAIAAACALAVAGLATVPWFGRPFAWGTFFAAAKAQSKYELGLDPNSSLLPLDYMLSTLHAREVFHTLLLVDGVGWILLLACGAPLLLRGRVDAKALVLVAIVGVSFAYVVTFDPVFGAYADWDLYSYGAAVSALLGAWALVTWGRACPRPAAALAGLALAASCVHLLARLNALNLDQAHHRAETPYHIQID